MAFLNKTIADSLKLINDNTENPEPPKKRRGRPPKRQLSKRVPRMSPTPRPKQFTPFSTESTSESELKINDSVKVHDTAISESEAEEDDFSLESMVDSDELKYLEKNFSE